MRRSKVYASRRSAVVARFPVASRLSRRHASSAPSDTGSMAAPRPRSAIRLQPSAIERISAARALVVAKSQIMNVTDSPATSTLPTRAIAGTTDTAGCGSTTIAVIHAAAIISPA